MRDADEKLSQADVDFAVFLATRATWKVGRERWVDPPSVVIQRMYDMRTEAHRATIRVNAEPTT